MYVFQCCVTCICAILFILSMWCVFFSEMTLDKVFVSILGLLPPTKSSDADYCIIREVVKQPLFNQRELPVMLSAQAPNISEEYILSHGLVRLLVEVDAVRW